jgi:polysaccharide pyruvyl transferase WcaK-like protein
MGKKHVLIINQGKSENLGDKVINIILQDILKDNNCEFECAGFTQCSEQNMAFMTEGMKRDIRSSVSRLLPSIFLWFIKYYWNIKNEFIRVSKKRKYDLVIIGGGQLIKTKCVFPYALLSWYGLIKKYLKCPIILLAVGVDDKFSMVEKLLYKKILPGFSDIYVRDHKSKQILFLEFGINTKYIPDVAFSYSKYYPLLFQEERNIILLMIYNYDTVKYNFGMGYSIEEYYKSWEELLMSNITPDSKIVLAYTTIDDKKETTKFAQYLKEKSKVEFTILFSDNLDKFVSILIKTEKVISGRMHALILGMNYGCAPIPYIISSKIGTFKKEWIDTVVDINLTRRKINDTIRELLLCHIKTG